MLKDVRLQGVLYTRGDKESVPNGAKLRRVIADFVKGPAGRYVRIACLAKRQCFPAGMPS